MINLAINNRSASPLINTNNVENSVSKPIGMPLMVENQLETLATEQKIKEGVLPPLQTGFYKNQLFKTEEEAHEFLNKFDDTCDGFSYSLSKLRAAVRRHLAHEIEIPEGVNIHSVAKLFEESNRKREPTILVKLGILKDEQFKDVNLEHFHKDHLLSDNVILQLICATPVNLKALSKIPEEYVELGVIKAIIDKREDIIDNMVQSHLFVNTASDLDDTTPLHIAASIGSSKIVTALLKLGAQASLNMKDTNNQTPLEHVQTRLLALAQLKRPDPQQIKRLDDVAQILCNARKEVSV